MANENNVNVQGAQPQGQQASTQQVQPQGQQASIQGAQPQVRVQNVVKPLPAAFMSLVAKEVDSVTLSINKINLLEFVKGLAHEAIKVSFENPSQADLIRMFAKEVDNDDSKMERMLATYFPSAKNSVRPVKTLVALTVNATTLTPETPVKSLFDLQSGTDVTKVSQFTNREKLFFDSTVVPTPYEYNPTMGTVKYYVNTLIVLLAYLGIDYKNNIEAANKKVSVSEELDSYSILIRN